VHAKLKQYIANPLPFLFLPASVVTIIKATISTTAVENKPRILERKEEKEGEKTRHYNCGTRNNVAIM
jgi:hypothetical protein